ncbi:MAG TPA: phosphosulfolactate synthase [Symbiobacteriaceae bacterium]|nr:phosphosulfolactate synthase [Symbiobacteriaceae bacterium]
MQAQASPAGPRGGGQTMIIDKGLGLQTGDLLELASDYIDYIFEVALTQDRVDQYFGRCKDLGFNYIEMSVS